MKYPIGQETDCGLMEDYHFQVRTRGSSYLLPISPDAVLASLVNHEAHGGVIVTV